MGLAEGKMRRKFLAFLMAVCMMFTLSVRLSAETVLEGQTEPETELSAAALSDDQEMLDLAENNDLLKMIMELDPEKVKEYIYMINEIWASEDFQSLLQHAEVQELIREAIKEGGAFSLEEPELVSKILITLGVDERFAYVLKVMLQNASQEEGAWDGFVSSEEGKAFMTWIINLMKDPETQKMLQNITAVLQEETADGAMPETNEKDK